MSTPRGVRLLLFLLCLGLVAAGEPQAAIFGRIPLHLKAAGSFDPRGGEPRIAATLSLEAAIREQAQPVRASAVRGHWIVQFDGPVEAHWKTPIEALGVRFFDYLPEYAFVVRTVRGKVAQILRQPHVRAVVPFHPAYALSPDLVRKAPRRRVEIQIGTFAAEDVPGVVAAVRRRGGRVRTFSRTTPGLVTASVLPSVIPALARVFGVSWIEPRAVLKLHNNIATTICNVDDVRMHVGLYGSNQIVAVADTGLDTGDNASVGLGTTAGTLHPDFKGRLLAAQVYNDRGTWNDPDGHGTHTSGSVLASGEQSGATPSAFTYPNTSFAGAAPDAQLVFQSIMDADGGLLSTLGDVYDLFQGAYDAGARIHSDSWGSSVAGVYTFDSQSVDRFMWDHPDALIVFSAGNDGIDDPDGTGTQTGDGVVNLDSMGAPGTAKSCLTVGASENNRGATFGATWNQFFGADFPTAPISTDYVANNASGMAAFSSRGPCDDTRIKPDIVAPGTFMASTRTRVYPLDDNVEAGTGSWIRSSTSPLVANFTRTSGSAASGSFKWHINQANTSGTSGDQSFLEHQFTGITANVVDVRYRINCNLNGSSFLQVVGSTNGGGSYFPLDTVDYSTGGSYQEHVIAGVPASDDFHLEFWFTHANGTNTSVFADIDDIRIYPNSWGRLSSYGVAASGDTSDESYIFLGGTSMSTPFAAGGCALVRQFYQEVRNHASPSAALIKATIMASATSMAPGQYGTGTTQEIPTVAAPARGNNVEGWGRLDLQKAVAPQTGSFPNMKLLYVDAKRGLNTSESDTYSIAVTSGTPLTVLLAYTDAPASTASSVQLVNDLDLDVIGPAGAFSGNGVANDNRNPVESIDLSSTVAGGIYTITINSRNAPRGPQPYALVIYGDAVFTDVMEVTPGSAQCQLGQSLQFTALFNGVPTPAAAWSLVSGVGTIDSQGLYKAPASGSSATIRATFGSYSAEATIALVSAGTTQANIEIFHTRLADLTSIRVGCGNPASPDFITSPAAAPPGSGTLSGTISITGADAFLPPSAEHPWFLEVKDTVSGQTGAIRGFYITYNGQRYNATNLVVNTVDSGTSHGWIDLDPPKTAITAPAASSTLSGSQAFTATASDNDQVRRVEFYVDDRLIGSDTTAPYATTWDTTRDTNATHRLNVRAYDASGNTTDDSLVVRTDNTGTRPNVESSVSGWNFNTTSRVLTATLSLKNTGNATAFRVTAQRVTLWGTGATIEGENPVYMQPASGAAFPRSPGSLAPNASFSYPLSAVIPPEIAALPRWTTTGFYYDASSGGTPYRF